MQCEINGNTYEIGRLNARKQFHCARRIAPLSRALADVWPDLQRLSSPDADADESDVLRLLPSLGEALASLPEKDVDAVLDDCLSVTRRKNAGGTGFSPVLSSSGELMFQDMGLAELTQIVWRVLGESLGNFTDGLNLPSGMREEIARRAAGLLSPAEKTGS